MDDKSPLHEPTFLTREKTRKTRGEDWPPRYLPFVEDYAFWAGEGPDPVTADPRPLEERIEILCRRLGKPYVIKVPYGKNKWEDID